MKRGGERKDSRRITMSVIAAISPYESNRGGRGGCLGFLVYLFSALQLLVTAFLKVTKSLIVTTKSN